MRYVVKTDAVVEHVHFRGADPPDLIARKALRVNVSDLSAKGATPVCYTLAAMLPERIDDAWLEKFSAGLAEDQRRYAMHLIGGDSTRSPGPIALSITAIGRIRQGRIVRRSGARVGDRIFVSGTVGDAALGLAVFDGRLTGISREHESALTRRYLLPEPRLTLGLSLPGLASAALDVSDGLVGDLEHIVEASGVGAEVDAAAVPLSAAARDIVDSAPIWLQTIVTGGDDYEILFTAPAERAGAVTEAARSSATPVAEIGRIVDGRGVRVRTRNGGELDLPRTGYRHF
jgi:thiamine-monophosphate kinase